MQKIVLLGGTGYIGQAFRAELSRRDCECHALTRREGDYTRFEFLLGYLRKVQPAFLINAAGYTGKPNVDACETARADTLQGNTLFPQMVAQACEVAGVPWGHVSSGCIYSGAKIVSPEGQVTVEKDMTRPAAREVAERQRERVRGFTETDAPNFSFRDTPCSFYSGTKALGEEAIEGVGRSYIWRLRIPFDEVDNPRNYLTKIQRYSKVYDNVNSLSHRGDFVRACVDLWEARAPFGIYNVTNPGWVTTREVVEMMQSTIAQGRSFEFWESDDEFYRLGAKTPRSNCVLEVGKLLAAGVKLRPVKDAVADALRQWRIDNK
jgi:dTDP-4-dehydrorhamnose reductase